VTDHDVLYGYRLALFELAAETMVSHACRVFGVQRLTFFACKRRVERHGLGMLRPRERRRRAMPNQTSLMVEQRVVAYSLAYPGQGPRRISSEPARDRWAGLSSRRAASAGPRAARPRHARAPTRPRRGLCRAAPAERPNRAGRTSRPRGRASWSGWTASSSVAYAAQGRGLADQRHRHLHKLRLGRSRTSQVAQPTSEHTSRLARRVAVDSPAAASGSSGCSQTTATSFAAAASPPPSAGTTHAKPTSTPAAHTPTGTHKRCNAPASKNAGAPRPPAHNTPATPASAASSTTTSPTTTPTGPTTAASPKNASPSRSSTPPTRCEQPDDMSGHLRSSPP
jgi:hypothetical protein